MSPKNNEIIKSPQYTGKAGKIVKYWLYDLLLTQIEMIFKCIKYVQNDILAMKLNNFVSIVNFTSEVLEPNKDGNNVRYNVNTKKNLPVA